MERIRVKSDRWAWHGANVAGLALKPVELSQLHLEPNCNVAWLVLMSRQWCALIDDGQSHFVVPMVNSNLRFRYGLYDNSGKKGFEHKFQSENWGKERNKWVSVRRKTSKKSSVKKEIGRIYFQYSDLWRTIFVIFRIIRWWLLGLWWWRFDFDDFRDGAITQHNVY